MNIDNYDNWIINEYDLWKSSLIDLMSDNTKFENFKSSPAIQKMVGISNIQVPLFLEKLENEILPWNEIVKIDNIGNLFNTIFPNIEQYNVSSICLRYVYYANKILNNIKSNTKIVEIGGGYGGFAAILHVLAKYKKISIPDYGIFDLPEVQKFQKFYLKKAIDKSQTGIQNFTFLDSQILQNFKKQYHYCVSFYALGEFPLSVKQNYIINIVSQIEHGFIIWNTNQNEDNESLDLLKKYHANLKIIPENPLTSPNNLEIKF